MPKEKIKKNKSWPLLVTLILITLPLIIWFIYYMNQYNWIIDTKITADGLLGLFGSLIAIIATILTIVVTVRSSKNEIIQQTELQYESLKWETKREYDKKLYDEISDMAKDILIFISLSKLMASLSSIHKPASTLEYCEKASDYIHQSKAELLRLHKLQWFYYEQLKRDGFLDGVVNGINIKKYFRFIYDTLNTIDDMLSSTFGFNVISQYKNFFEDIDKFSYENQHSVQEHTQLMLESLKEEITLRLVEGIKQ